MPEFRIRHKKKRDPRRRTLNDSDETTRQILAARELMQQEAAYEEEQVNGEDPTALPNVEGFVKTTSSSDPAVKVVGVRKIASSHQDCFFLRYGPDTRRCPMPSPITLSTIKNLFVNLFDLDQSVLNDPKWHLFILNSSSIWMPLNDVIMVDNHCTVLLVDSADISSADLCHTPEDPTHVTSHSATTSAENITSKLPNYGRNGLWRDHLQRPASTDPSFASSTTGASGRSSSTPLMDTEDERRRESLLPLQMSPLSMQSSTSGVVSDSVPQTSVTPHSQSPEQWLSTHARSLYQSVHRLKGELDRTRKEHKDKMTELQVEMIHTKKLISATVMGIVNSAQICSETKNVHGIEQFRKDRLKIMAVKEEYSKASVMAMEDVRDLEKRVDSLRVDAVNRRCKIDTEEVEDMLSCVRTTQSIVEGLKRKYFGLEFSLKDIMKRELEVIVAEEKFMQEENLHLDEAAESCRELSHTLDALNKLSQIQEHRAPSIPYIASVESPDRKSLLDSISAIYPNHQDRMESLQVAEATHHWRKQLHSLKKRLKKFEDNLHMHKKQLRPTGYAEAIDRQRQMKLKAMYMQERIQISQGKLNDRERHAHKKSKTATRRKSDNVTAAPSDIVAEGEESQMKELRLIEEERRKLEEERFHQMKEHLRLEETKKRQEQEQQRIDMERRLQEEERRKLHEERRKQKAKNKLAKERLHRHPSHLAKWEEYSKNLSSDSPRAAILRKEMLWQEIQKQAQMELEQEEEIEKEKRMSTPQIVINGSTGQTSLAPILRKKHGHKDSSDIKDRRSIGYFGEFDATGVFSSGPMLAPVAKSCRRADSMPRQVHSQTHLLAQGTPPLLRVRSPDLEHRYHSEESLAQSNQNIYDPPWDQSRVATALHSSHKLSHGRPSALNNRRWTKSDKQNPSHTTIHHQHWKSLEDDREVGWPDSTGRGQAFDPVLSRAVQHNLLSQQQRYRSSSDHRLAVHSTRHLPVSEQTSDVPVFLTEAVSSYPGYLNSGWTSNTTKAMIVSQRHSHAYNTDMRSSQYPQTNVRRNQHKAVNISYV